MFYRPEISNILASVCFERNRWDDFKIEAKLLLNSQIDTGTASPLLRRFRVGNHNDLNSRCVRWFVVQFWVE